MSFKRQPARRFMIKDVLEMTPEKSAQENYWSLYDGVTLIRRVRILGTVTKIFTGAKNYQGMLIDDGTGAIFLKSWDDDFIDRFGEIKQWDLVEVIGSVRIQEARDREGELDLYLIPELISSRDDTNWEIIHRAEILLWKKKTDTLESYDRTAEPSSDFLKPIEELRASMDSSEEEEVNSISLGEIDQESLSWDSNKSEVSELTKKIDEFIQSSFEPDSEGVRYEKIKSSFSKYSESEIDDSIFELLTEGKIYEPKASLYKPLT